MLFNKRLEIREKVIDKCVFIYAFKGSRQIGVLKGLFESDKIALLADIDNERYVNHGVGTMLIYRFEDICRQNSIKKVYGNLACTDIGHKDRLIHFYQKHGYEVIEENESSGYWGKIIKNL